MFVLLRTVAAILLVGAAALLAGRCAEPPEYTPLRIVDVSPVLLDDRAEMRDYVNAFPIGDYEPHAVQGGYRFFVDDPTDMIKQVIVAGYPWERHLIELFERYVDPATVVVEVGAHMGTHTVPMSRLVGPWGRVYAFEPQRKIYRELHHNLALNGVNNAVILPYAVGAGETRIIEMNPATSGNEGGTGVGHGGDRAELRALDSFGFERVSLLKIDVEGYENEVLDGAVDTIRRNRPVIILEIAGGQDYATASADARERIQVTWRKLEALDYTVTPVFKHDYIARPAG